MSHNIFQDYFLDARGKRPWHNLGHYTDQMEIMATEAFDTYTPVNITLEPMYYEFHGVQYKSKKRSVVRWPLPQQGFDMPKEFAVVGPRYTLVEPREVVEIIDSTVNRPIETIGLLEDGTLFTTIAMDHFEVAGDQIERYLLISAPCNGKDGYEVAVTQTRVVCNNTLVVGLEGAKQRYTVRHDRDARDLLEGWMSHAWEESQYAAVDITAAFNAMAQKSLTPTIADALIGQMVPMPAEPSFVPVERIQEKKEQDFERAVQRVEATRDAIWQVWDGDKAYEKSQGYQAQAWDTTWGLYNAASEVFEYGG